MAKIKRYRNGDTCPCCGQVIQGKTAEELAVLSVRLAAIGFEADLDPFFPELGGDYLEVSLQDMQRALDEWCRESEAGDNDEQ